MTYTSRYLVPLSLILGACLWACGSSNDIPESSGDGDGDGTGTGGLTGDGDVPGTGGVAGDGDGDGTPTGGVAGDGDGDGDNTGAGGLAGDGDGDGTGGMSGDGDGDGDGTGGAPVMGDPAGESCALGTNYSLGEMRILNNQWTSHQADQCIFINEDRSFGWRWDNTAGTGGFEPLETSQADYPNYPEVEFGINPWGREIDEWEIGSSSTTLLPIRLGDLDSASMTINANSTTNSGGSWNLAFELWLSPTNPALAETAPTAEIMIFFGNDPAYWPESPEPGAGATLGDYTLYHTSENWAAGYAYRQWRKNGTSGGSTSFNGTLDIKPFLDQAGFDENWYVTRFEIGNEVYVGSQGETTIQSLSFEVNGESRSAL